MIMFAAAIFALIYFDADDQNSQLSAIAYPKRNNSL
jgi:hypothetical protein